MAEKKYENVKATKSSNKAFVPWPNANKNKSSSSSKSNRASTKSSVSKKSSTSSSSKKNSRVEQAKATRVEKNLEISVPSNSKVSKKVTKELTKKTNKPLVISIVLCLVIGIVLGYFCLVYLCKNDCFEMNVDAYNQIDIYLNDDDGITEYTELGAKCVLFGKDISSQVKVQYKYREDISFEPEVVSGIDSSKAGIYYAIYTIDNPRYKSVTLIRNIIVLREEE